MNLQGEHKHSGHTIVLFRAFPSGSVVKRLPTMRETWVRFLGWEDPLEMEMATHSSTLGVLEKSHGWRTLVGYSPWDPKELDMTK